MFLLKKCYILQKCLIWKRSSVWVFGGVIYLRSNRRWIAVFHFYVIRTRHICRKQKPYRHIQYSLQENLHSQSQFSPRISLWFMECTRISRHLSQKLYVYLSATDSLLVFTLIHFGLSEVRQRKSCFEDSVWIAVATYSIANSIGTFMTISFLRNAAIRGPLQQIRSNYF